DTTKRLGCCHHGAILRVGGGRNLGSETATARPTVLDNFMGPPLLRALHGATASIPVEAAFYALRVVRSSGFPSSNGLSRQLFLERHGHSRVCREANPLPLDVGDQPEVDEMRVALVLALAAVALREPDAPVGDTVDGADVDAVRANHFHVLGDLFRGHLVSPLFIARRRCRTLTFVGDAGFGSEAIEVQV